MPWKPPFKMMTIVISRKGIVDHKPLSNRKQKTRHNGRAFELGVALNALNTVP
jgi:hypothetical protein